MGTVPLFKQKTKKKKTLVRLRLRKKLCKTRFFLLLDYVIYLICMHLSFVRFKCVNVCVFFYNFKKKKKTAIKAMRLVYASPFPLPAHHNE